MKPVKIFLVTKYVKATSIVDAVKKERDAKIDGIVYQCDFKKQEKNIIGF